MTTVLLANEFPGLPTPPSGQLESWLIVFGCVLGLYWLGRQIFLSHFPPKNHVREADRYVTHAFLDLRLSELKTDLTGRLTESRQELAKMDEKLEKRAAELSAKLDKQDQYLHEGFHRIQGGQGTVQNDMSYLRGIMEAELKQQARLRGRRGDPEEGLP